VTLLVPGTTLPVARVTGDSEQDVDADDPVTRCEEVA
jgi:hypothetical protein